VENWGDLERLPSLGGAVEKMMERDKYVHSSMHAVLQRWSGFLSRLWRERLAAGLGGGCQFGGCTVAVRSMLRQPKKINVNGTILSFFFVALFFDNSSFLFHPIVFFLLQLGNESYRRGKKRKT
jgi:hypothetical protein